MLWAVLSGHYAESVLDPKSSMSGRAHPPYFWLILVGLIAIGGRTFGYWQLSRQLDLSIGVGPNVAGARAIRVTAPALPPYPSLTQKAPSFAARQYALYDADAGVFIVEENADQPVPLASTTKIMTAYLAIEQARPDDVVTVTSEAAGKIGSTAGLRLNERLSIKNLLYGALLASGNDAAYAVAGYLGERIGGDESATWQDKIDQTVELMNAKAKELGLASLRYVEPSGLDAGNVGSARDLAVLSAVALENDTFREITSTPAFTVANQEGTLSHELKNSNRLVGEWAYPGAIGVKTGFTPEAGHNLVGAAERDGHRLVAVVLNTYDSDASASARVARDLLDFAWRSIRWE